MIDLGKFHKYQSYQDHSCGPNVVSMIFDAKGVDKSLEEISKELFFDDSGTFAPDLARLLTTNGINTNIILANTFVFDESFNTKSLQEKITHLEKWLEFNKKHIHYKFVELLLSYIKSGGQIEILPELSTQELDKRINEGYQYILGVIAGNLWGKNKVHEKQEFDMVKGNSLEAHFVILNREATNTEYEILDSYPTMLINQGIYNVNKQRLLNSSLLYAGVIIEIKL